MVETDPVYVINDPEFLIAFSEGEHVVIRPSVTGLGGPETNTDPNTEVQR